MKYQAQRGTNDLYLGAAERWLDTTHWTRLETIFRQHMGLYGYSEIRTPIFEDTEVFLRTVGETSDIVSKEMYRFTDKGDRDVCLRPELTAPVMRALIQHSLVGQGTVGRFSYFGPIFRYERPQKGRYRQAHQFGLELVGSPSALADAEVIEMTVGFYQKAGILDARAQISSLGRQECRARYREQILAKMERWLNTQDSESQDKARRNPLRLLDSKDEAVQTELRGLPPITDFLEPESRQRFEGIQELLGQRGIPFVADTSVVRGLDYYTETVFEVHSPMLGAQTALCGGGRYDDLIKQMGGPQTPSVGVGMGVERCLIVLDELRKLQEERMVDVFIVQAVPSVFETVQRVASELRIAGVRTVCDIDQKSMKSQMGQAAKSGAKLALILGDEEMARGVIQIRTLANSSQEESPLESIIEAVKQRL